MTLREGSDEEEINQTQEQIVFHKRDVIRIFLLVGFILMVGPLFLFGSLWAICERIKDLIKFIFNFFQKRFFPNVAKEVDDPKQKPKKNA
jgi:hypothetical protein